MANGRVAGVVAALWLVLAAELLRRRRRAERQARERRSPPKTWMKVNLAPGSLSLAQRMTSPVRMFP
jgi:hypothetical protein